MAQQRLQGVQHMAEELASRCRLHSGAGSSSGTQVPFLAHGRGHLMSRAASRVQWVLLPRSMHMYTSMDLQHRWHGDAGAQSHDAGADSS